MEPTTARIPRKLVLHFDVNETIMVGDPAAGIDFGASLNNIIAKAAFISKTGKLGFFIISASVACINTNIIIVTIINCILHYMII